MKLQYRGIAGIVLLLSLALLPSPTCFGQPQGSVEGQVYLQTKQNSSESFSLVLGVDFEGIAAAVVHSPAEVRDLVRIVVDEAENAVTEALSLRPLALASLSVGSLEGPILLNLEYDAASLDALEVLLVSSEGTTQTVRISSSRFAAGENQVVQVRAGSVTVKLPCSESPAQDCETGGASEPTGAEQRVALVVCEAHSSPCFVSPH